MSNSLKKFSIALALVITIVSSSLLSITATANSSFEGTVDTYILNVREKPNTSSPVIEKLNRNDSISILSTTNNWGEISVGSRRGYVSLDFIKAKKSSPVTEIWVSTNTALLNIREKADTTSKVVGSLKKGESVKVIGKSGKWVQVLKGGTKGYAYLPYLIETSKPSATPIPTTPADEIDKGKLSGKVTASALNVREKMNTNSKIIGALDKNQTIQYQKEDSNWGKVVINGKTGYISLNYVLATTDSAAEKEPEKVVIQKIGTITASALNIRSQPNATSNALGVLKKGSKINIESIESNWIGFTHNNKKAYAHADYVSVTEQNKIEAEPSPKPETSKELKGYVTASSLNVREQANTNSKVLGSINKGDEIKIESITNNWAKVLYKNGTGYISASYIKYTETEKEVIAKEYEYIVKADVLNVRDSSSINGKLIAKVSKGDTLTFTSKKGEWLEVSINGKKGFVHSNYVETKEKKPGEDTNVPSQIGTELAGKVIVLDAGHGGTDSGANGNEMKEKDVVLDVTLRTKKQLESRGAKVLLTRGNDTFVNLNTRYEYSNKSGAHAFISIHANSSYNKTANGIESYYYEGNNLSASSEKLTTSIHKEITKASTMTNRGVKKASFQVIKYNKLPSTLLEIGFISNSFDSSFLKTTSYRDKVADSISRGLIEYFK